MKGEPGRDIFGKIRPSEKQLTSLMGVRPPRLFTRFVEAIHDQCDGDPKKSSMMYWYLTGLCSSGVNMLYDPTPRELFAIGDTGCDGEHAGFLVHAPEAPSEDYPWVLFTPPGADLSLLAGDTETFFFQLLSHQLTQEPEHRDLILGIAQAIGIKPDAEVGARLGLLGGKKWWESEPKVRPEVVPVIPDGWWFEPSRDGVGVLAPIAAFAPEGPIDLTANAPSKSLQIADEALKDGFAATALLAARSLYEGIYNDDPEAQLMMRAYRALGRDLLAKRQEETS